MIKEDLKKWAIRTTERARKAILGLIALECPIFINEQRKAGGVLPVLFRRICFHRTFWKSGIYLAWRSVFIQYRRARVMIDYLITF